MILSGAVVAVDNKCALENSMYGNARESWIFLPTTSCLHRCCYNNSNGNYYYKLGCHSMFLLAFNNCSSNWLWVCNSYSAMDLPLYSVPSEERLFFYTVAFIGCCKFKVIIFFFFWKYSAYCTTPVWAALVCIDFSESLLSITRFFCRPISILNKIQSLLIIYKLKFFLPLLSIEIKIHIYVCVWFSAVANILLRLLMWSSREALEHAVMFGRVGQKMIVVSFLIYQLLPERGFNIKLDIGG